MLTLSLKSKWLLVIIGSTKYVEGATRLQKYGLLVSNKVPEIGEFFNDWESEKFGVFSKTLAKSLETLQKNECVETDYVVNLYGKKVARYRISNKGRDVIQDLIQNEETKIRKICEITQYYFKKSLKEVLADVYILYPEFTNKSTIIPEVGRTKVEQNSFLSPEFEIPFNSSKKLESDISNLVTTTVDEHVFNDEDMREEIAKSIGLKEIPKLDPNSFKKLSGILEERIKDRKINSVDLVRSVRDH